MSGLHDDDDDDRMMPSFVLWMALCVITWGLAVAFIMVALLPAIRWLTA